MLRTDDDCGLRVQSGLDVVSLSIQDTYIGSSHGSAIAEKGLQSRLASQLHQYCFYPRSLLSPSDAVFVAKFIRTAHDLGTVGFSTVFAYNNVSQSISICHCRLQRFESSSATASPLAFFRSRLARHGIWASPLASELEVMLNALHRSLPVCPHGGSRRLASRRIPL